MESILDIDEPFIETDAIKSYEYNEYLPTSGSNLNTPGTITIHIESQDEFYHPRRSYLLVEGDVVKGNGTRYIEGADNQTPRMRKETMFIQMLEGLHADEAQVVCHAKDKRCWC